MSIKAYLATVSLIASSGLNIFASEALAEKIVEKIALEIGDVRISEYELNKAFSRYLSSQRIEPQAVTPATFKMWYRNYIDDLALMLIGWEKGYLNSYFVESNVRGMEKHMLMDVKGFPHTFITRRGIELIMQPPVDSFTLVDQFKTCEPIVIEPGHDIYETCIALPDSAGEWELNRPLEDLDLPIEWKIRLSEAEPGAYFTFMDASGEVRHLWRRQRFWPESPEEIINKATLFHELSRKDILPAWKEDIGKAVKVELAQESSIQSLAARLKSDPSAFNDIMQISRETIGDLLDTTALSYFYNGRRYDRSWRDFLEHNNKQIFRKPLKTADELRAALTGFAYSEVTYARMLSLGAHRDPQFALDRRFYRYSLLWLAYERTELLPGIDFSEASLRNYYSNNEESFSEPTKLLADVYVFSSQLAAKRSIGLISRYESALPSPTQTLELEALLEVRRGETIDYSDLPLNEVEKRMLMHGPNRILPTPLPWNGEYAILVKNGDSGNRIPPYEMISEEVAKRIEQEETARLRMAAIKQWHSSEVELSFVKDTMIYGLGKLGDLLDSNELNNAHVEVEQQEISEGDLSYSSLNM